MHTHTPLPTGVFDYVNTPIACINTTDIGRSISFHIAWKILPSVLQCLIKMYPFCTLKGGGHLYNTYVSRDTEVSCQLVPTFISNKHNHLIGISNPEYQCYLNFVIQVLLPILRTIIYNFQFNTSAEGSLSFFYFKQHMVAKYSRIVWSAS